MRLARAFLLTCAISCGIAVLSSRAAIAGWSSDPAVNLSVCSATHPQTAPVSVSDGAGGIIIAWVDYRVWLGYYGEDVCVYAQRISAAGVPLWTPGGVLLSNATGLKSAAAIASDGANGAIVTWADGRNYDPINYTGDISDIFAQRISGAGVPQWQTGGVSVCSAPRKQIGPVVATDGAGGGIITWYDERDTNEFNFINVDIYAQRVSSTGALQWAADGVALCTAAGDQKLPVIAPDDAGGAIVTWQDLRVIQLDQTGYTDLYSQRVSAGGVPQWTADGVALCTGAYSQLQQRTIPDGSGGAIVTWQDARPGSFVDAYAQRISGAGVAQWTANGVAVCASSASKWEPAIATDGAGGAIIAWGEYRFGNLDIYAQKISAAGTWAWPSSAVLVCSYYDVDQRYPAVVSDGAHGAVIAWLDLRNGVDYDLYAQRLSAAGVPLWTIGGEAVCTAPTGQQIPVMSADGAGGGIVAWADDRDYALTSTNIYAQRVLGNGQLGPIAGVPVETPIAFALEPVRPNPSRGGALNVSFTLPDGAPASLELLDVAGRRVAIEEVGALGAGRHALRFGGNYRIAPGLYLVRLTQGANVRVGRVARLD